MSRFKVDLMNFIACLIVLSMILGTIIYLVTITRPDPWRALGECERLAETHDIDMVSCLDVMRRN